ncbi:hypothetical protein BST61_g4049 [Cercospora zeina]
MAAIFNRNDLSSPSAYNASQTALLLLDFQPFIIAQVEDRGTRALNMSVRLRDWALQHKMLVIHSIVDVNGQVPKTAKGASRLQQYVASLSHDQASCKEHSSIAPISNELEHTIPKRPGIVSNIASQQMQSLLAKNNIKSLVVCGLSTSGAVLRTCVQATDQEFVCTVVEDACADKTEELHDILVKDVLSSRAHVTTAANLMKEWKPQ